MKTQADEHAARIRTALTYLAAQHGGDRLRAAEAGEQAARWRERHPDNDAAWSAAQMRWQAVHRLTPQLDEAMAAGPHNPARRRWLGGAAAGSALGLAAWLGFRPWHAPEFEGRWVSARGERLPDIHLPGGSLLALAPDTAASVIWHRHGSREAVLERGHGFFDIAASAVGQRPFTVRTRLGSVRTGGGAFSVSDRGREIQVAMARGMALVQAIGASEGDARELVAGERVALHALAEAGNAVAGVVERLQGNASDVDGWRTGWWTFTGATLAEVAAEFNAWSDRRLQADNATANLRLTGSFPIAKPDVLLKAIGLALPVQVTPEPGGWIVEPTGRPKKF